MEHTATYSPEDNKIRIYPAYRLDKETYTRVRNAGFIWAPKQELFVAPMWTPDREDLALELCGEIGDEDTSLVDRAEQRAERFEDYSAALAEDADLPTLQAHAEAATAPQPEPTVFDQMRDTLKAGVQVVSAPQLFPTPTELAARMVELAEIEDGQQVLEPSAGTGAIVDAIRSAMAGGSAGRRPPIIFPVDSSPTLPHSDIRR